jgi:hypothetical protein
VIRNPDGPVERAGGFEHRLPRGEPSTHAPIPTCFHSPEQLLAHVDWVAPASRRRSSRRRETSRTDARRRRAGDVARCAPRTSAASRWRQPPPLGFALAARNVRAHASARGAAPRATRTGSDGRVG